MRIEVLRLPPTLTADLRLSSSRRSEVGVMNCPACGNSEMITQIKDETLSYGGQSLTLHLMKGDFCPTCREGIWDAASYLRYAEAQAAII